MRKLCKALLHVVVWHIHIFSFTIDYLSQVKFQAVGTDGKFCQKGKLSCIMFTSNWYKLKSFPIPNPNERWKKIMTKNYFFKTEINKKKKWMKVNWNIGTLWYFCNNCYVIHKFLYPTQRVAEGIMFLTRPSVSQSRFSQLLWNRSTEFRETL